MPGDSAALSTLRDQLAQDEKALTQLAETIADVRQTIADAEATLERARREQRILEARMAQKQMDVDAQRRILSPITRLPNEMLATVMRLLYGDRSVHITGVPDLYLDSRRAAISCASVCQRWRVLAISCPWLWNRIYV
ncbi:hypothetical protein AURDEDRAFT_73715, partial [Auricularia subglabra TFB-10046 SS5]